MFRPLCERTLCHEALLGGLRRGRKLCFSQPVRSLSYGLHLQPHRDSVFRLACWQHIFRHSQTGGCRIDVGRLFAFQIWRTHAQHGQDPSASATHVLGVVVAAATLTTVAALKMRPSHHRGLVSCEENAVATWPIYSREEISKHTSRESGVWVTYKDGVYDITNFIINHPGGTDKIMLAAGKSVDPFWRVYQQHESRQNATQLLSQMQIGVLDPADVPAPLPLDDPYASDPQRHPGLLFHNTKPCNAELPIELVLDNWITPNPLWFIRHHHPVPVIDGKKFELYVDGLGTKSIRLDMEDLRTRFTPHDVVCTIQCGGNRRGEFNKVEKTSGIAWGCGAMSTAKWTGALLRDVLTFSGLMTPDSARRDGVEHVVFEAIDGMQASIPIEKALSVYGDALLAYEMNGEPLPYEHGFPVRVVVPGHVGVRNVKWVSHIRTSSEEAHGPWQRGIAYKGFSPSVKSFDSFDEEQIAKIQSIQDQPVTSMIISPKEGFEEEFDDVTVRGIAWSGGGRGIIRVDVSADGGQSWITADLQQGSDQHPTRAWAWTFWEAEVPLPAGSQDTDMIELCCKATDASYNTQPESINTIWNLRGLNNNSWSRVKIRRKKAKES